MPDFNIDYKWQLKFLPLVKKIIGPMLLVPAPFELDATQATDLILLTARDMRIACRLRRAGYADRYPWDFTIRSARDNGATTELKKLQDGLGDWFFYGHVSEIPPKAITRWFLIDLNVWRAHHATVRPTEKANGDGTYFLAYDVRYFPHSLVIASSCKAEKEGTASVATARGPSSETRPNGQF